METNILRMIDNARDQKLPISYYTNRQDTDLFSVGMVIAHDNDYLLTAEITPEGKFDGYSLQRIEAIYRVDIGDSYVKEILSKYSLVRPFPEPMNIKDTNIFNGVIRHLKDKSVSASFCLNSLRETDFDGIIKDYTESFLHIQMKNEERFDGESVIRTDSVFSIIWGN